MNNTKNDENNGETGLENIRSIDSTSSQYHNELGRFTRPVDHNLNNDFQVGELLFDSVAVLITCSRHNTLALSTLPNKQSHWFPICPIRGRQSYRECVDSLLQQLLTQPESGKCSLFKRPQPIEHLRIQIPQAFYFVNRVLYQTEIIFDSTIQPDVQCCGTSTGLSWVPFQQILSQDTPMWGEEPQLYLHQIANKTTISFDHIEWSIKRVMNCLTETGPAGEMVRICALAEKELIQLFGEFVQHCFPSSTMNLFMFRVYMGRLQIWTALEVDSYFRAFAQTSRTRIDFHEFIQGMAALDKRAPHGGPIGLLRVGYIFRYYNMDHLEGLSPRSVRYFTRDLLMLHKGSEPKEDVLTAEVAKIYEGFGVEPNSMVPSKIFAKKIGSLAIRGTSSMFRTKLPPFNILRSKMNYPDIHKCPIRIPKTICSRCREKQYTLASHQVTLGRGGTIVEPVTIRQIADVQRMSKIARKRSDRFFQERDICNELLDAIRKNYETPQSRQWYLAPLIVGKIVQLCNEAKEIFSKESRVISVSSPVYILGDIHGNLHDLMIFEHQLWRGGPSCLTCNYLFLGDYVDRGAFSLECIVYLLCCKILAPDRIIMLRGNHETRAVQQHFTFYRECMDKFREARKGTEMWELFNDVFDMMPLAATIDEQIWAAHGGIPATVTKIQQLLECIPCPMAEPELDSQPAWEILWNDPVTGQEFDEVKSSTPPTCPPGFVANLKRGTAYYFAEEAVNTFMSVNGLTHIVRAHEVQPSGFNLMCGGRVITVFSCSQYCGMMNEAAVLLVDSNKIRIIKIDTRD
ncbi:hypothetical protein RDWZM_000188 [Blomia tropicalis]|uniref:Serine/threonine-protein phosphatase n=1 Tax=Blomia tropicalis TaxID=40697 RepID=A0A9Q0M889_BLOTA|nr:hypothetical protein RDWZM_000188 [Blomia tropicalis]